MKKHLIISLLGLCAFVGVASAQSYAFSTDLFIGSQGSDVANLQTYLVANGFNIVAISSGAQAKGYYGTQTASAVANFQKSVGINPTGYFGPQTRAWINAHGSTVISPANPQQPIVTYPTNPTYPSYPTQPTNPAYPTYPSNNQAAPIIVGVDAPTSLAVNQVGTWNVRASNPSNGTLSYMVDWGDSNVLPAGMVGNAVLHQYVQTSTFTHSYSSAGTYTVRFTVQNSNGYTAQSNISVQVSNGAYNGGGGAGPLQITSPNGGEIWQRGTTHNITWTSPYYFVAAYATLQVTQKYNCTTQVCPMIAYAPYTIATNIPINQNSYSWNVGTATNFNGVSATLPDGQYSVQICQTNSLNSTNSSNCDSSNATFTITSGTVTNNGLIQITSPNGGEVWAANSIHPITWNFSGSNYYSNNVDIYLGQNVIPPCIAIYPAPAACSGTFQTSYVLDRNISSNTQYNWVVGTDVNNNVIPAGNYSLEICPAGSTSNCDVSNSAFAITGTAYPYYQGTNTSVNTNTGGYYIPPTYANGTYSSGYASPTGCPAGYVCTPVANTTANYSY